MKKILILLLVFAAVFVFFTACANNNADSADIFDTITDAALDAMSESNLATNDNSQINSETANSDMMENTLAPEFDITAFGDIEINGEYFVPTSSMPDMTNFLEDVRYIYYKEMVVAAYKFKDESNYQGQGAMEFFNTTTGESLHIEPFEYPIVLDSLKYDKNTDSISLWTQDRVVHYIGFDSVNVNAVVVELPDYLKNVDLSNPTYSYDGLPFAGENAWWGATFEDGLALQPAEGNPSEDIFIPSTWLMDNMYFSEDTPPEFRVASFNNVQIINDGRFVVCAIAVPGSQTGHVGLYTLNTQTLEENFYFDIFVGMFADYSIINDDTIMVTGYDSGTKINVEEGTTETFLIPEETNRATYNYKDYFVSSLSDNGKIIHAGDENAPIATTSNEKTFIHQAIENYLVLVNYSDDYGVKTVLIKS